MFKQYRLIGLFAMLVSLSLVGQALAHAKLVTSTPAVGAKLAKAPATVTLVFSEEISEQQSSFLVADAKGATVGTGKLDLNDLDHKTLTAPLKPGLGDGIYLVTWKTVTPDDNGVSEGRFTFGVNAEPGVQPTAAPEKEPTVAPTVSATLPTAGATAVASVSATPTSPQGLPVTGDSSISLILLLIAGITIISAGLVLRRLGRKAKTE